MPPSDWHTDGSRSLSSASSRSAALIISLQHASRSKYSLTASARNSSCSLGVGVGAEEKSRTLFAFCVISSVVGRRCEGPKILSIILLLPFRPGREGFLLQTNRHRERHG